jgi:hypothetical protein
MASEVIQHAERLKRLLNQDDGSLTTEVTNFLNKYAVASATPLVQASSRAFNDTDLYELLLDKGRDILPAELFSRFMMFYATLGTSSPRLDAWDQIPFSSSLLCFRTRLSFPSAVHFGISNFSHRFPLF